MGTTSKAPMFFSRTTGSSMVMIVLQVHFVSHGTKLWLLELTYILISVNNGAHNVTVRNMVCEGGHGASLSGTDLIADIHFDNITSRNSLYGGKLSPLALYYLVEHN